MFGSDICEKFAKSQAVTCKHVRKWHLWEVCKEPSSQL